MPTFTNRLNLQKPAGGSSGTIPGDDQADIDVLNDNADKIDAAVGVRYVTSTTRPATPYDGQLIKETDTGKLLAYRQGISDWEDAVPSLRGSSSLRDLYYSTPGTAPGDAAARVALANKYPRWLTIEKGYEQQYFAAFDDAGVSATTPVRATAGWAPSQNLARVPISRFTLTGANAVKQGSRIQMNTNCTEIIVDDCFTDEFDAYEVEFTIDGMNGGQIPSLQFRKGGVTNTAALYHAEVLQGAAGTASAAESNGAASLSIAFANLSLHTGVLRFANVGQAANTQWMLQSASLTASTNKAVGLRGGVHTDVAAQTGFRIAPSSSWMTGWVRIYGLN